MLRFNFNFLDNIEPNLTTYLDIAQECMATDPHNTMAKSRACLEYICKDILINHDKVSKKHKQDSDKNPGLGKYTDILADCKALDKNLSFIVSGCIAFAIGFTAYAVAYWIFKTRVILR